MQRKFKCRLSMLLILTIVFTSLFTSGITVNPAVAAGTTTYVSDMAWTSSTCGSPGYSAQKDKNVVGNAIVIGGITYTKGIGTHAFDDNNTGADVVVNISGQGFTTFEADVGVDDGNNSSSGSIVFKVIVDGVEKAATSILRGSDAPYHLTADVTGGSTLTLRVMNGGDGYIYDWASWGNAKLTGGTQSGGYLTKVNCGGSAVDGLSADQAYTSGSWGYVGGYTTSTTSTITNNYGYPTGLQSVRYGTSFDYKFDVLNGTYNIKLYFAECWDTQAGRRPMDISINGTVVLSNFDPWTDAGAANKGVEKVFTGISAGTGQIDIHFAYHTNAYDTNAMVGVIVVESATPTPTLVKVNCGGGAVDGLSADQAYTPGSWGYTGSNDSYSTTDTITNNYGYPTGLKTCRYSSSTFNYKFDVPNGTYKVKLYFADPTSTAANVRKFNVKINNADMLSNYDIFADAGGRDIGIEKVFPGISVTGGQVDIQFISIPGQDPNAMVNAIVVQVDDTDPVPSTHWDLNTADTYLTLAVANNRPAIYELKNPSKGWNWTNTHTELTLPTRVQISGGADYPSATWTFQSTTVDTANGKTVTMKFTCDQVPNLAVKSVWWAASQSAAGPVQHTFVFENNTGSTVIIYPQLEGLDISVKSNGPLQVWRFSKDGGLVTPTGVLVDSLQNGSSFDALLEDGTGWNGGYGYVPLMVLDSGDHGLYVGWESQDGRINASAYGVQPVTARVKAGYNNSGSITVSTGITELSSAYLGVYSGDVDAGTNGLKRWYWNNKVPANMRNDPTEPWTQYGGMFQYAPGWGSNEAVYTRGVATEKLSNTGFEAVEIDYGWWGPLPFGVYSFDADPTWWPSGMTVGGQLAHNNGFKFTLYFASMVNWDNKETLHQKMTQYGADTFRNDFQRADLRLMDWLIANHSGFRYENCDGGAHWKDYATMRRASVITSTDDVFNPLSVRKAFYDSSYCLPPAQISQCLDWTQAPDDQFVYWFRSGMLGQVFTAMADGHTNVALPSDRPSVIQPMKDNLTLYKSKLRPLIRNGDLYHVLPRPDGVNWDGIEYYDPSTQKGAVCVFKPNSTNNTQNIKLKGLNGGSNYALTFNDGTGSTVTLSGDTLMNTGINVTLNGTYKSEIIWIN